MQGCCYSTTVIIIVIIIIVIKNYTIQKLYKKTKKNDKIIQTLK